MATPSAEKKDSTVVAINSTGIRMLRSNTMRMSRITARMMGMISARSRSDAAIVSTCTAVVPPIFASGVIPARSSRKRVTVAWASSESDA